MQPRNKITERTTRCLKQTLAPFISGVSHVCFERTQASQWRAGANAGQHTPTLSLPPSHKRTDSECCWMCSHCQSRGGPWQTGSTSSFCLRLGVMPPRCNCASGGGPRQWLRGERCRTRSRGRSRRPPTTLRRTLRRGDIISCAPLRQPRPPPGEQPAISQVRRPAQLRRIHRSAALVATRCRHAPLLRRRRGGRGLPEAHQQADPRLP